MRGIFAMFNSLTKTLLLFFGQLILFHYFFSTISLRCVYLNNVSILHLKASNFNLNESPQLETDDPQLSGLLEEYQRLSTISIDQDEEYTEISIIMSRDSIVELLYTIDMARSVLSDWTTKFERLHLGRSCLDFIRDMIRICQGKRYKNCPLCRNIMTNYSKVKKISRDYDKFMEKLDHLNIRLLGIRAKTQSYIKAEHEYVTVQKEDKDVALKLCEYVRRYFAFDIDGLYNLFERYNSLYCNTLTLYMVKDKLITYKPSVSFKGRTKHTSSSRRFSRKRSISVRNEAFPLKQRSNRRKSSKSRTSSSSPETKGYLKPTISYINKIKSKKSE
ncbi:uncharacterized protein cubi_01525 [Cryptosporidium ubiquitum]|uniref:Uncharacterized protein n=1 Tax=Cryptosporidium ubiquitum TaxID=857276 RepID=A0A1J4MD75_9CRYT|nr:uncharacterized protein cubi_01525 [Cryptosporidium ubiquitum]OII72192.1 hypothetical protein cubi_01525 [Cryptosporidium ubiquitum]